MENKSLQAKINILEIKLRKAEQRADEHVENLTGEKGRRIEILENELARIQANEDTLNETIEELREVENALRSQVNVSYLNPKVLIADKGKYWICLSLGHNLDS